MQISDTLDERGYGVTRLVGEFSGTDPGYRLLLAGPLWREERIVGGLVVWRREAGNFSNEVINLIETFAAESVLAIQKRSAVSRDRGKRAESLRLPIATSRTS